MKIIGRPQLMRVMVGTGMRSRTLMEWVLRIMANLLRPDELGPAEAAYRAVAALARLAPARYAPVTGAAHCGVIDVPRPGSRSWWPTPSTASRRSWAG